MKTEKLEFDLHDLVELRGVLKRAIADPMDERERVSLERTYVKVSKACDALLTYNRS